MVDGSLKTTVIRSNNLKIKSEGNITKCPVCHKAETWDVANQYCSTCRDVEQNPSVLRLATESAITQKKNNALVLNDAEAQKLNIKNEMQAMFVSKVYVLADVKKTKAQIDAMSADEVWDLHQKIMTDLYEDYIYEAKSKIKTRVYGIVMCSAFIGSMTKGLIYGLYGSNSIFPIILVPCFLIMLIITRAKLFPEESKYITKYREFEKLHGKNARFF